MKVGPIKRIIIHVRDFEESSKFYGDLMGFEVDYTIGENWVCFKTGQALLCLMGDRRGWEDRVLTGGSEDTICFEVEDVAVARDALREKGIKVGEVESVGENAWVAKFRDPDGRMLIIENAGE